MNDNASPDHDYTPPVFNAFQAGAMNFSHITDPLERVAAIKHHANLQHEQARRENDKRWGRLGDRNLTERCWAIPDALHPLEVENGRSDRVS